MRGDSPTRNSPDTTHGPAGSESESPPLIDATVRETISWAITPEEPAPRGSHVSYRVSGVIYFKLAREPEREKTICGIRRIVISVVVDVVICSD